MLQPHIRLDDSLNIKYALLPGDPARLDKIAAFLTDVEQLAFNREYRSLRGRYHDTDVLAVSTGIGGSSASIAVEELHKIGKRTRYCRPYSRNQTVSGIFRPSFRRKNGKADAVRRFAGYGKRMQRQNQSHVVRNNGGVLPAHSLLRI